MTDRSIDDDGEITEQGLLSRLASGVTGEDIRDVTIDRIPEAPDTFRFDADGTEVLFGVPDAEVSRSNPGMRPDVEPSVVVPGVDAETFEDEAAAETFLEDARELAERTDATHLLPASDEAVWSEYAEVVEEAGGETVEMGVGERLHLGKNTRLQQLGAGDHNAFDVAHDGEHALVSPGDGWRVDTDVSYNYQRFNQERHEPDVVALGAAGDLSRGEEGLGPSAGDRFEALVGEDMVEGDGSPGQGAETVLVGDELSDDARGTAEWHAETVGDATVDVGTIQMGEEPRLRDTMDDDGRTATGAGEGPDVGGR